MHPYMHVNVCMSKEHPLRKGVQIIKIRLKGGHLAFNPLCVLFHLFINKYIFFKKIKKNIITGSTILHLILSLTGFSVKILANLSAEV